MNLFDPTRPQLPNSRPAWLRNHIAISHFEIFPLPNNKIELSIWLPIRETSFSSKRFSIKIDLSQLNQILLDFTNDPEKTCEELFSSNPILPELRTNSINHNYIENKLSKIDQEKLEKLVLSMEI